jgi:ABC-2 type transport system ATP-binding protein
VNNAVEIRNLKKNYGETHAVAGVDLDVYQGEVFALLGPNGAGKTTTIEILEGYRDRDGGNVSVLGEDPARAGLSWRNKIGIVLQNNNDAAEITVEEILNFFSDYYVNPRNVDEVIQAVGLEEKRKSRGRELSGGQRRRLDVALGILGNPELLFLDEPTTGFDPEARRAFWDLIRGLRADGTTILLTTHYLDEAEALADRVGVINHGRIIEVATPATLGGRDDAKVMVRWRENGSTQEERTDSPTEFLRTLSSRLSGEIPELTVSRPTLEDIYISMIEGQA